MGDAVLVGPFVDLGGVRASARPANSAVALKAATKRAALELQRWSAERLIPSLLGAALFQAQRSCHIAQVESSDRLVVMHGKKRATREARAGRGVQGHAVGARGGRALEAAARLQA